MSIKRGRTNKQVLDYMTQNGLTTYGTKLTKKQIEQIIQMTGIPTECWTAPDWEEYHAIIQSAVTHVRDHLLHQGKYFGTVNKVFTVYPRKDNKIAVKRYLSKAEHSLVRANTLNMNTNIRYMPDQAKRNAAISKALKEIRSV